MRLLLSVLFSLFSFCIQAQTFERGEWDIWQSAYPQENAVKYIYAGKALVRDDSSQAGQVLDTLLAGTKVKLLRKTSAASTINNIYAHWIEVEYNAGKKGFVWLGLIAFQELIKGDTVFLYGIDRVSINTNDPSFEEKKLHLGLKAVVQNVILDKKEWSIAADESSSYTQSKLLGNMGLQNMHEILRFNSGGEACGIPTNYFYHGWNGQRFFDLPGKYTVGDADVFYHVETLLFPAEPGGRAGHIIRVVEEEEMLEEEKNGKPAKYKKRNSQEWYVWNGEKAVKIK